MAPIRKNYTYLVINTWFYYEILGLYDEKNRRFGQHVLLVAK